MHKNLIEWFAAVASTHARRTAIVEVDRRLTYADLEQRVCARAQRLVNAGVGPGQTVALYLGNGIEYALSFLAIAATGAVVAPLNDHYRVPELTAVLAKMRPSRLLSSLATVELCASAIHAAGIHCELDVVDQEEAVTATATLAGFARHIPSETPLLRLFSSGTTGTPRPVTRNHQKIVAEIALLHHALAITPEDRFLGAAPFAHVNGLVRTMLSCLMAGATLVPLRGFGRHLAADCIEQNDVSVLIGVPFMFAMLSRTSTHSLRSLRLCVSSSAPLTPALNLEFADRFGIFIRQIYGSTETGSMTLTDDAHDESNLASVGRPLPGVTLTIIDSDGDGDGEVAVASPLMFEGYDGQAMPDPDTFRDRRFLSGDLGHLDSHGRLHLSGRKKLLINRAGYKVNPDEIERVILTHPKVAEVVVVGETTGLGDDRVKAVIVARETCTEVEIVEHCRKSVADFKVPSVIVFRDELPLGATGKVDRKAL